MNKEISQNITHHGKVLLKTYITDVSEDNPNNCPISTIDFRLYKPKFEPRFNDYMHEPIAHIETVFIPLSTIDTIKNISYEKCQNFTKYAVFELQNLMMAQALAQQYPKNTTKTPGYLYVHCFFIEPEYRQKGWSNYLWNKLDKWLYRNGFAIINTFAAIDPVIQFEMPKEQMVEIMKKMLIKQGFHAVPEIIEQYTFTFDNQELYIR